jgi:hypothetical protein
MNMIQSSDSQKHFSFSQIAYVAILVGTSLLAYFYQASWLPLLTGVAVNQAADSDHDHDHDHGREDADDSNSTLKLSTQARLNLNLETRRVLAADYWKRLVIPGEIVDRPGVTDRSLTSPIAGVITEVHAQQGDIISPGDRLVTLRLVSDYLQKTQADLFKAIGEIAILKKEIARIRTMAENGIIPEKRIIVLQQNVQRQETLVAASRQDLMSRGFSETQVLEAERGHFLTSIEIKAPMFESDDSQTRRPTGVPASAASFKKTPDRPGQSFYEVQELITELGHQVASGERIAVLSDHQHLLIRGHAFKREAINIEQVMKNRWNVDIEFVDDSPSNWPQLDRAYQIRHLANEVDSESNTFDFFIPMENQSRVYETDDRTSIVWRYRPGQQVRLKVPLEKIENVFTLPRDAVVREGAEVYAFQAFGGLFRRFPVHVVFSDSQHVVLANDGSFPKMTNLAINGAASLNRVLKSQSNDGGKEFHVHADGSVHSNDDH